MPSAPEFGGILCFERRIEVVLEAIAEKESKSDRHVGITREIAVKLYGESYGTHQILESGIQSRIVEY